MNIDKLVVETIDRNPLHFEYSKTENGLSLIAISDCIETKINKNELLEFIKQNSTKHNIELVLEDIGKASKLGLEIVKISVEIAKKIRRGMGNIMFCGSKIYETLMQSKLLVNGKVSNILVYESSELDDYEGIIAYISDSTKQNIRNVDSGMFITKSDDGEIYVSTFDSNDISRTPNYYAHIVFSSPQM